MSPGARMGELGGEAALADPVIWHDLECGSYAADLPLWEELADATGGPVLELGCGTGRVALHLARRAHRVTGVDREPDLLAALSARARAERLPIETRRADVTALDLERRYALVLAPMQLAHVLPRRSERGRMLAGIAERLRPGGLAAISLLDPANERLDADAGELDAVPDVRERDGWIFSSLPLSVRSTAGGLEVRRLRQVVSPDGRLEEQVDTVVLADLAPEELEREAVAAGLTPAGRRGLAPTDAHVGSLVVLLEPGASR